MSDTSNGIELRSAALRLALRPDLGGCIAGLWWGDMPVMRSTAPEALSSARTSACYPLLPYSNRVAWRRFEWQGQPHTTEANFDASPHSVHGVAWQRPWRVVACGIDEAVLAFSHRGDAAWPFDFEAEQVFTLRDGALDIRLTFTNSSRQEAPAGMGWHPYFPKRARSRLHMELSHRWESDAQTQLPTGRVPQSGIDADVAHLQFDHCFDGWRGPAHIRDEFLSLRLTSSLDRLVVFTPQDRAYFCVEPVSHVSNAINMERPLAHGIRSLQPGERSSSTMTLQVADVH